MKRKAIRTLIGAALIAAGLVAVPAMAESGNDSQLPPIDAAKIENAIKTLRANGLSNGAIQYAIALDGIMVPDSVLSGGKTVKEAIGDGSIAMGSPPAPVPQAMQPTAAPAPDLSPKGSSASGWTPNTTIPAIDAMRKSIQSAAKPPNC